MPRALLLNSMNYEDDQLAYTRYWMHVRGSNSTALDHTGRLFLTLPRLHSDAVRRGESDGELFSAWDPSHPLCFVHAAGNKDPSFARKHRGFNFSVLGLY